MKTSTLELIQIASPCEASWDAMQGDNRVRFCGHCKLNVYHLSDMTREEAEKLVHERSVYSGGLREGRLCVRFFRRHDGTVLTRDCPVGLRAVRQRLVRSVAALAGLLLAMIGGTAFGSLVSRWLPGGLRTPSQSLTYWVSPSPDPIPPAMGQVVMGGCPAPPIITPPTLAPWVKIASEGADEH